MSDAICWTTRLSMATLDRGERLTGVRGEHAATCLRCQAEAAKYDRMLRGLARLAASFESAPHTLVPDVLDTLQPERDHGAAASKRAGLAAAGAAAVVAAGTVVVLRRLRGVA